MGPFITWVYLTFIDTYPGPGIILSARDMEMNKDWPLPMKNPLSGRDGYTNGEVQLRYTNRVSGT